MYLSLSQIAEVMLKMAWNLAPVIVVFVVSSRFVK